MTQTPTTLVIFAHPALERARISPALVAAAQASPGVVLRDIYELYPDFIIDAEAEQAALADCEHLVLQFPLYWGSAPALLKEWLDMVFTQGFAYGETASVLAGKTLTCAVSTGGPTWALVEDEASRFRLEALLLPFEQTACVCRMRWRPPFTVHGAALSSDQALEDEAARYAAFLSERG